jgi:hypothetical protein
MSEKKSDREVLKDLIEEARSTPVEGQENLTDAQKYDLLLEDVFQALIETGLLKSGFGLIRGVDDRIRLLNINTDSTERAGLMYRLKKYVDTELVQESMQVRRQFEEQPPEEQKLDLSEMNKALREEIEKGE